MRKRTIFGITMLLLVLLMSLTPVVKATAYCWDGIRFVEGYEGKWIKYPHPDNVYYDISKTTDLSGDSMSSHPEINPVNPPPEGKKKINPTNPWMPWLIIIIVVAVVATVIYLYKKRWTK